MHPSDPISSDPSYSVPPFPSFPSATRYVPLGSLEEALSRVCRSVDAREAISLVIGPPGTGKSLMSALLEDRYRATHQVVTLGETPLRDRDAFLRRVLRQLGVDLNAVHSDDLQLAVLDRVQDSETECDGILLVIDEAQSLSTEVLEAIRTVTNIMHRGEPRVFAVLCGGVKLDETLVQTSMEAFRQRVSTRCYLHPMNGEETKRYVAETIRACGAEPEETITAEAIAAVHHACSGVPRLLNQLLTQAIDCAEEADQSLIDERVIDVAWAQLQQLPSPMVEEPKIQIEATAVEFGELDEPISEPFREPEANPSREPVAAATDEEPSLHVHEFPASVDDHVLDFDEPTSFDDIVVEHGSAQWLTDATTMNGNATEYEVSPNEPEPPAAPMPVAKSSAALFGDFDEEEDISVGEAYQRPVPATDSTGSIEDILQQEIVGISPFPIDEPSTGTFACGDHNQDTSGECEREVEEILSLPPSNTAAPMSPAISSGNLKSESPASTTSGNTAEPASTSSPLRIVNDDASTSAQDTEHCETISDGRDDTDILVIEEEVEVRRIDRPEATAEPQPVLSIDYQQMLSRMRSGT